MKKLLLFTFLFLGINNNIRASHATGGEITYSCLGNDQYAITLTFYRDCIGIPASSTMLLVIENNCGLTNPPVATLLPTPSSPVVITPICPTVTSTCQGGLYLGIEKWVYTGIITLPGACSQWTFSHSENARNSSLTTITGAGSDDLYMYATVNNTSGLCNNSAVFGNDPEFIYCLGQFSCINLNMYDADGDSLVFQLTQPKNGPLTGDTVTYLSGYSYTQPIHSNPPITFNSATGELCMAPSQVDVSPFAILVKEYRNGVLIGTVVRDIQINIISCNNIIPDMTGINGSPSFSQQICAGENVCFNIYSVDPDFPDNTFLSYDQTIAAATFTTTGGHRDTAQFCWTPALSDTSGIPYCFSVTVTDDSCPYIGKRVKTYCLFVVNTMPPCTTVAIENADMNFMGIRIFPQPASESITIDFGSEYFKMSGISVHVYSLIGKHILLKDVNEQIVSIDGNVFHSTGVYLMTINDKSGRVLAREKLFIIQ